MNKQSISRGKHVVLYLFLFSLFTIPQVTTAQPPDTYFPTQVGNLWQYYRVGGYPAWEDWNILQDSIATDGYRYLYVRFADYPGQESWWYRLDTTFSVYRDNGLGWGDTLYRLAADSGDVWLRRGIPGNGYYSWVIHTYQDIVFGRATTVKVIRSGPAHPDSGGNSFYFEEQHLATGFGVIYH